MFLRRPIVRFWSRKPFDLCSKYILKYSVENDLVLDSFGGSGSIVQTALFLKRRAVYIDANPYAWLVAYVSTRGVDDVDKYLDAVNDILARNRIFYLKSDNRHWTNKEKFYQQYCPKCKMLRNVKYYKWDNKECKAILSCNHIVPCNDLEIGIPKTYPYPHSNILYYDLGKKISFDKRRNVDYIHELFTRRNLLMLATLLHDIDEISYKYTSDVSLALYFTFTSILYDSSKMARKGSGSWGVPSYWVPRKHLEKNPYELFRRKAQKLANYFTNLNKLKSEIEYEVSTNINDVLDNKKTIAITIGNALNLKEIPDNSIDLVFTDPPHTGEIQYFELSYFYWSWLTASMRFLSLSKKILGKNMYIDFSIELNTNTRQGKSLTRYIEDLKTSIKELYRVTKKRGYTIIILHEENPKTRELLYNSLTKELNSMIIIKETIQQRKIGERKKEGNIIDVIISQK